MPKRTIIDLFAGVGGLSMGFSRLGFEIVFANDFDAAAAKTFMHNHPNTPFHVGAIEEIDVQNLVKSGTIPSSVDVLVGGVPCQAFSMAGYRIRNNRKEEFDQRVYLFRHFLRFVKQLRPKFVVIENVKGLTSMLNGDVISEILRELRGLGYMAEWKYLNAADYGAPQLRERTVIIANNLGLDPIFPLPTVMPDAYKAVSTVLSDVVPLNHEPRPLSGAALERVERLMPGQNWKDLPPALQTKSVHSGAYGRIDPTKPSRTLTTRFDTPSVGYVTHPFENRCLTVREGARIQGFPDSFEFLGTRMQQYRQVGNAVSPYMSDAIAKLIAQALETK